VAKEIEWVIPTAAPTPPAATEAHGIKFTFGFRPRDTRVWIDGHEVTRHITAFRIDASAGDRITALTLELVNHDGPPVLVEGELRVPAGALDEVLDRG